jgi:hypothetical protein
MRSNRLPSHDAGQMMRISRPWTEESTMKFNMNRMPIGLSTSTPLNIEEAQGATLRVMRGRVWVTQEGSVDDVFIDAGGGHTFRADGRVVISAEGSGDATIVFDAPLAISERASLRTMVRRLVTWHPTPMSTRSDVYEGV